MSDGWGGGGGGGGAGQWGRGIQGHFQHIKRYKDLKRKLFKITLEVLQKQDNPFEEHFQSIPQE